MAKTKEKKVVKPNLVKPIAPNTKESIRATTQKPKEKDKKKKKATEQKGSI